MKDRENLVCLQFYVSDAKTLLIKFYIIFMFDIYEVFQKHDNLIFVFVILTLENKRSGNFDYLTYQKYLVKALSALRNVILIEVISLFFL